MLGDRSVRRGHAGERRPACTAGFHAEASPRCGAPELGGVCLTEGSPSAITRPLGLRRRSSSRCHRRHAGVDLCHALNAASAKEPAWLSERDAPGVRPVQWNRLGQHRAAGPVWRIPGPHHAATMRRLWGPLGGRKAEGMGSQRDGSGRRSACVVLAALLLWVTGAPAGGTGTKLCIPAKEGKSVVTPKGGACKPGYSFTEVGPEGKEGKEGAEGRRGWRGKKARKGLKASGARKARKANLGQKASRDLLVKSVAPEDVTFYSEEARQEEVVEEECSKSGPRRLLSTAFETGRFKTVTFSTQNTGGGTTFIQWSNNGTTWFEAAISSNGRAPYPSPATSSG